MPRDRHIPPDRERLKPATRSRLQPNLGETAGEICRRRIGSGGAGGSSLQPFFGQELDVVEQPRRLNYPLSHEAPRE